MRRRLCLAATALPVLLASYAAGAQSPAPILAILDLQVTGVPEREMTDTVDCLARAARDTGVFGRVLSAGSAAGTATDAAGAARIAKDRGADLALFGSIRLAGNDRVLTLTLVEAYNARVLLVEEGVYPRLAVLRSDCARVARLMAERRPPPAEPAPPRPPTTWGGFVRLGHEGVSRTTTLSGGSNLYVEMGTEIDGTLGLAVRYSTSLVPAAFDAHLLSARIRIIFPVADEFSVVPGFGYLLSTSYGDPPEHWVGLSLCPVYSGDLDGIAIELVPFALYYNPRTREVMVTFELLSLGLRVFYRK